MEPRTRSKSNYEKTLEIQLESKYLILKLLVIYPFLPPNGNYVTIKEINMQQIAIMQFY